MEWNNRNIANNALPSVRQSLTGNYVNGKIVYIGGQTNLTTRFDDVYFYDPGKLFLKNLYHILSVRKESIPKTKNKWTCTKICTTRSSRNWQ